MGSSLAIILAHCMATMVQFWFGGCARPLSTHFDDFASMVEPNRRSCVCGEL